MNTGDLNTEKYFKKLMTEGGLVQPPERFTQQVLQKISVLSPASQEKYKPILSRKTWMILAIVVVAIFTYSYLMGGTTSSSTFNVMGIEVSLDLSIFKEMFQKVVFSFELSPIMQTSILALVVFTFSNLIIFELRNRSFIK